MPLPELIGIPFSHYVEKARWALDLAGVDYVERKYMPLFSSAAVVIATRGQGSSPDRVSTRYSVPTLVLGDGTRLGSSAEIVRWASDRAGLDLYPRGPGDTDEVVELEQRFHDVLGPHARRGAYGFAFQDADVLNRIARDNVSRRQALAFAWCYPVIVGAIRTFLKVDDERCERSRERVRAEFDFAAEQLSDGRPFLLGDRFSAADLAFATMAVPVLLPTHDEGFGAILPRYDTLPTDAVALVREMRSHSAGQFALRLFREHRQRPGSA